MAIQFSCSCGRQLKVAEEHAGKKVRCPACKGAVEVPAAKSAEFDIEVVEEQPEEEEIITAVRAEPKKKAPPDEDEDEEDEERPRKRKKKRRARDKNGPLSQMYMAEAREQMRRDRMRATGGRGGDDSGGWTMFGVHLTAGVLSGLGMLILGLGSMAIIGIVRATAGEDVIINPRLFIGALVFTTLGAITFVKSVFFGEED